MKHILTLIILLSLHPGSAFALDNNPENKPLGVQKKKTEKKPHEMEPKLLQAGATLVEDNFDGDAVDSKWIAAAGTEEGRLSIVDGALKVALIPGGGLAYAATRFASPERDVVAQFLIKPHAAASVYIAFRQKTLFDYVVYANGLFQVVEQKPANLKEGVDWNRIFETVTLVTDQKDGKKWQRICIECAGEKLLVRQNNKVIYELQHKFVAEEKTDFVLASYNGAFMLDEIKITEGIAKTK